MVRRAYVTVPGDSMASRVAQSLLKSSATIPGIVRSLREYVGGWRAFTSSRSALGRRSTTNLGLNVTMVVLKHEG